MHYISTCVLSRAMEERSELSETNDHSLATELIPLNQIVEEEVSVSTGCLREGTSYPSSNGQLSKHSEDSQDTVLDADIEEFIPTPPDGGWGWMIVLSSFMNHFILDGICYAFGAFMLEYSEYFQSSAAATSALMSTLTGCYMLSGMVTCCQSWLHAVR